MGRVSSKSPRSAGGKAKGDSLKAKQATKVTKKPAKPVATVAKADRFERQMRKEVKRQALISALEDTGRRRKEEAEKKRRAARPVVGDLNPMADSIRDILDQVEEEDRSMDAAAAKKNNKAKKGGTKKERRRKKDFLASVRAFGSVLRDEEFKKDPLAAITAHVHHKVESQEL